MSDIATVVELACLTRDRTAREQRALFAVALKEDLRAGRFTVTNRDLRPPYLARLVLETYHSRFGRAIPPSRKDMERLEALEARWQVCGCGKPVGAHTLSDECAVLASRETR